MVTAEFVRRELSYDHGTGEFIWRTGKKGRHGVGKRAGCRSRSDGYGVICLNGRLYRTNRLAWLYMTGEWPSALIDHEDMNSSNDRWDNLRLATPKQNCENGALRSDNTSGVKGVRWNKRAQSWVARIFHNHAEIYLGHHQTLIDAVAARYSAERQYFTHSPRCAS